MKDKGEREKFREQRESRKIVGQVGIKQVQKVEKTRAQTTREINLLSTTNKEMVI